MKNFIIAREAVADPVIEEAGAETMLHRNSSIEDTGPKDSLSPGLPLIDATTPTREELI